MKGIEIMKLKNNSVILFSGDSITHGGRGECMDCNHIMGHGFQFIVAAQLALKNYINTPKFINKGYSGYKMSQLLDKWQEDVLDNKPTVLSILAGVNDCHDGYNRGMSIEEINELYESSLVKAIKLTKEVNPNVKVIICEPFYFPLDRTHLDYRNTPHPNCEREFLRPDRDDTDEMCAFRVEAVKKIQLTAKKVADEMADTFVPLAKRFEEEMAKSKPEYFIWDGTHPTIAGHALIAEEWLKATEKIL